MRQWATGTDSAKNIISVAINRMYLQFRMFCISDSRSTKGPPDARPVFGQTGQKVISIRIYYYMIPE